MLWGSTNEVHVNASVEEKVNMPGIALAATGAIGLLFALLFGLLNLASSGFAMLSILSTGDMGSIISGTISMAPGLIGSLMNIVGSAVVLMGGLRLKAGTSPTMVYVGAITAMIPCCNGMCCVLGLATGGWAIFVMQDEEVKAAMADA